MKNILALIGLVVVLFAGLGWYLGWYKLGSEPATDGHRKINVDLDTKKITTDIKKGEQRIEQLITPGNNGSSVPQTSSSTGTNPPPGMKVNNDGSVEFTFPKLEIKTMP